MRREEIIMSPRILRIIGIAFLVLAAVVAILDFLRGVSFGTYLLPALWVFVGAAFLVWASGKKVNK
jgi:hypothetical protein